MTFNDIAHTLNDIAQAQIGLIDTIHTLDAVGVAIATQSRDDITPLVTSIRTYNLPLSMLTVSDELDALADALTTRDYSQAAAYLDVVQAYVMGQLQLNAARISAQSHIISDRPINQPSADNLRAILRTTIGLIKRVDMAVSDAETCKNPSTRSLETISHIKGFVDACVCYSGRIARFVSDFGNGEPLPETISYATLSDNLAELETAYNTEDSIFETTPRLARAIKDVLIELRNVRHTLTKNLTTLWAELECLMDA